MGQMPRALKLICLAGLVLFFSSVLAQTAEHSAESIASALRAEQFDRALDLLQAALQQFPNDGQLWTMQGVAYAGKGQKQEALTSFRRALKIFPDNVPALQGTAQIDYDTSSAEGIPVIEHLLRLRPNDLTSHGMLAVLEFQQGQCLKAVPHFEKAEPLFESQLPALHAYATCLVKLKRFEAAANVLQKTVLLNPNDPRERQVLSSVQLIAHQPQAALATLDPLLSAAPDARIL